MAYDVHAEEPPSVRYQRRLEAHVAAVRDELTNRRIVGLVATAMIVYGIANGDASTTSSTGPFLDQLTLAEVVAGAKWYATLLVVMVAIISLHELCHVAAFHYFGVRSDWTIDWLDIRGYPIVFLPPFGGLCRGKPLYQAVRLSWAEDAVVSMAPLALTAASLLLAGAFHVLVSPIPSPEWFVVVVLAATGPSPPDYGCLLTTPRERWDDLVEWEEQLQRHETAEGIA